MKAELQTRRFFLPATWAQSIHRRDFGIHRFRVLTVTTDSGWVQGMIEAYRRLKQGRGLFLFTGAETLREQRDFCSLRWQRPTTPKLPDCSIEI